MFTLTRPTDVEIRRLIESQRHLPFPYPQPGMTKAASLQPGFRRDHNRMLFGRGEKTFGAAVAALRRWEMFNIGWVQLCWPEAPVEVGSTVAVLARHFGFWSASVARIVYLVDEQGAVRRFGFAYGTLPAHVERGEERFTIEWHKDDDSVWYDILAFSRPNHWLAWAGYPMARALQRRFARDSMRAMATAVFAIRQ